MKLTDFKIGDVVELNSSGPKMTVSAINDEENTIGCTWFNKEQVLQSQTTFGPETLKRTSVRVHGAIDV